MLSHNIIEPEISTMFLTKILLETYHNFFFLNWILIELVYNVEFYWNFYVPHYLF